MDMTDFLLAGLLTLLVIVLGASFRLNPLSLWVDLAAYFSRGRTPDAMRSRIDRQRDLVLLVCFLIFIGIPAAIFLWITYTH